MDRHTTVNQAFWDDVAPHHAQSDFYAIERFLTEKDSLGEIERAELGDTSGRSICHLQCHIGLDSLSLANRGADVTGVDFSAESLRIARDLSDGTGIPATFVQSDVLAAADTLDANFDIIFTTRGVMMWIADLDSWARNCARLLRPGGTFYLLTSIRWVWCCTKPTPGCDSRRATSAAANPSSVRPIPRTRSATSG